MRTFNGALAHFRLHLMREKSQKNPISIPGLKKLSLRSVSVFDVAEAEINQLSFGTLIDRIETGRQINGNSQPAAQ